MKPVTPGEILLEEYLIPLGISQNALGRALGVSPRAINEISSASVPDATVMQCFALV